MTLDNTIAESRMRPVKAFVAIDILAAVGLTIMLALMFSKALTQFAEGHEAARTQRVLRLAAETQLNRLRAAIAAEPDTSPAAAGLTVRTSLSPGLGPWLGFDLARVVAEKQVHGQTRRVELAGYVRSVERTP